MRDSATHAIGEPSVLGGRSDGSSVLYRGHLFDNQLQTLKLHDASPIVFDMSDPGTGKTRTALAVYLKHIYPGKFFVTCTRTTMSAVWADEIMNFCPQIQVQLLGADDRKRGIDLSKDVFVINHDGVKWLEEETRHNRSLRTLIGGSMLVNDESTFFKHRTSARSKAIARVAPFFKRRTNLSGAPMTNTVLDLWHQYYLLDKGQRLGWSFSKFRNSVCSPVPVLKDVVRWVDKPAAYAAVTGLVKDITVRHRLEDCADIPPNRKRTVEFRLSPRHRKIYEDMKKQALLFFAKSGKVIDAVNAGVLTQKLLQIASGAVYADDDSYELIDSERYELVADLVEERTHSLVFFLWHHQKDELIKEFNKRRLEYSLIDGTVRSDEQRHIAVREFQEGRKRVLLAHPKSAGHGLTLTRASAAIWASPTYDYEFYEQGFHRIYRRTQTRATETIFVVAPNTIDVRAVDVLLGKGKRQDNFFYLVGG